MYKLSTCKYGYYYGNPVTVWVSGFSSFIKNLKHFM